MSAFLDTGLFVAFHNQKDALHSEAAGLMPRALKGEFGALYTSDHVFAESVTLALARAKRMDMAEDIGRMILDSPRITLLYGSEVFREAWDAFRRYRKLSLADCVSVELMRAHGIDRILSFDRGFDGIVERVPGKG